MTLHPAFPAITAEALHRELERELRDRKRLYATRVEAGNMTAAEKDYQLAIAQAWQDDLNRMVDCWFTNPGSAPHKAPHEFSWGERRGALQRELDLRRRFYPQWTESGRLLAADAALQIAGLTCLAALYDDGWDWRASNGELPHFARIDSTPAIAQARMEWDAHRAALSAANPANQKELAL